MLTLSKPISAGQAQAYHRSEFANAKENYYTEGERVRGVWQGQLAERWGLRGEVNEEQFARLSEGQHPATGEALVRRQPWRDAAMLIRGTGMRPGEVFSLRLGECVPERHRRPYPDHGGQNEGSACRLRNTQGARYAYFPKESQSGSCAPNEGGHNIGHNRESQIRWLVVSYWCERRDSNPHGFPRQILSLVRLPIPPLSRSKALSSI